MTITRDGWLEKKLTEAREELPAAEREMAEASAEFERARWRRDAAVKRYRVLRETLEHDQARRRREGTP